MNSFALIDHLGWVLIHSLWQFTAIALVAGLVVWMLRRSTSTARYAVWVIAMGLAVAAPVVTWLVLPIEEPTVVAVVPPIGDVDVNPMPAEPVAEAPPLPANITVADETPPASAIASEPPSVVAIPITETVPPPTWSETLTLLLHPWMAWIVAAWCMGVGLCSLRPLLGWHTLWRLRTVGVAPVSDDIRATLRRVSDQLGLCQTVQVLQSTLAQVPVVVGYLRPVILLPVSLLTNMPSSQLEAILAHELAHIRRHDFVVNLLQTLVETLFFYHPAVWWLSRQIRVEREHCCDDLVVAALGNRVEYGRALLAIEELRGERTLLALGVNDGSLLSRIRRIVGFRADRNASSPWMGLVFVTCLFSVIGLVSVLGWTASAENQSDTSIETVNDDESDVEKSLEPPKPAIAEWSDGRSIEFVGITKNTAPANDGWLPSGLPIGDVPNWKSTIVLHGGNTSSSFTEGTPHPEPDADAIDFLFRFRGLKAQPSLTFDMPTRSSSYSNLPVQNPHELRVSAWKRPAQPPPGGKWTPPDGVVRVGLTDEPWGRYVKISPDGEVVDPIQPNELYASTYKLIDVRGSQPHDRISTGKAIRIREPSTHADPENPGHRYVFEFRAIDTDGKEHWAMQWEGRGVERTQWVDSQYGLAQPLPAGKTLSHYEYRLRPFRHWITFENVSIEPGPQTDVKFSTLTVAFTPEEKLADHFAAKLYEQKLPFLDDAKIANLRGKMLALLNQPAVSALTDEDRRLLEDEYREHAAKFAESPDVIQLLRYYFAGLKLPAASPEKWKAITEGVTQFVRREFDPSEAETVYLEFRDRFVTLQMFLAAALVSPEMTPEMTKQFEAQRAWMKAEILKLPESATYRLTHRAELAKLQALFDDPLNYFFNRPLSDGDFALAKMAYVAVMAVDRSEARLVAAVNRLASAIIDGQSRRLCDVCPYRNHGSKRNGTRWSLNTENQDSNYSLHVEELPHLPRVDDPGNPRTDSLAERVAKAREDRAAILNRHGNGNFAYDVEADSIVATVGARLAVLNATSWYAADAVPMADLRRLIEREGVESVPLSTFLEPRQNPDHNHRVVRTNAPCLVVQTQIGSLAVVRLISDGPVIRSRLRPLRSYFSIHPGDIVPTQVRVLNSDGTPATFNNVVEAQVGYPQKPLRPWIGWRDKAGLVSLETLPHGKHWILAAPEFEQRTVVPVTYPLTEKLVEWRLWAREPWTKHDLEFQTRFEPNEKTGGEIVITIQNKFDKPLTLSEADFSLHVGETAMFRAMSPKWASGNFRIVEIAAGQAGEVRLNWNDWVRKGLWASREGEGISEPTLPPNEPGRVYVRVCLGNSGALPIAVTDPAMLLAVKDNPFEVLRVGQTRTLTSAKNVKEYRGFDPKVLDVHVIDPRTLSITGVAVGLTVLTAINEVNEVFQQLIEVTAEAAPPNTEAKPMVFLPRDKRLKSRLTVKELTPSVPVQIGVGHELEFPEPILSFEGFDGKTAIPRMYGNRILDILGGAPGKTTITVKTMDDEETGAVHVWQIKAQVEQPNRLQLRKIFSTDEGVSLLETSQERSSRAEGKPPSDAQAKVDQPVEFRGTVRDSQQKVIPETTVALSVVTGNDYERSEKTIATTVVDASGAFRLSVSPMLLQRHDPRAKLNLWAWGSQVERHGMTVQPLAGSVAEEPYDLELLPPKIERIQLIDDRSQLVRGVVEQLSLSMGFDLVLPDALAKLVLSQRDHHGEFELKGFPSGDEGHRGVWMQSVARGRRHFQWKPSADESEPTQLHWPNPVAVHGRLTAAKGSLPPELIKNAEVVLTTHAWDIAQHGAWCVDHQKVRCDADGRFEVRTLSPGSLQTEVLTPGITGWKRLNPKDARGESFTITGDQTAEIEIKLAQTRTLQGRFVTGSGEPLPCVELGVMHGQVRQSTRSDGGVASSGDQLDLIQTDADGNFSLEVVPGRVSISKYSAPGSSTSTTVRWLEPDNFNLGESIYVERGEAPMVLPSVVCVVVSGHVVDSKEQPLEGLVIARLGTPPQTIGMAGTDANGRFRLETMGEPQSYRFISRDAANTLPFRDEDTETVIVTREPLVLQVIAKKQKEPEAKKLPVPEMDALLRDNGITKLTLVYFKDQDRRTIPAVLLGHELETHLMTSGLAGFVSDHIPAAVDRTFMVDAKGKTVDVEYHQGSSMDTFVYRAVPGLVSTNRKEPVSLAVGDSVTAISLDAKSDFSGTLNAATVAALNATGIVNHRHFGKYQFSGFIELNAPLLEGTLILKQGTVVGIVQVSTRFLGPESRKCYAVPFDRMEALSKELAAAKAKADAADERQRVALMKSVVTVTRVDASTGESKPKPNRRSGILVDDRGYILTPYYSGDNPDDGFQIRLHDQSEHSAKVVATDPKLLVALLQISPKKAFDAIPLDNISAVNVGESVTAIFADRWPSIKTGKVTGVGIELDISPAQIMKNLIQTDAVILPGDGGSLMVNAAFQPVGLWWAIRAGKQRLSFGIPLIDAVPFINKHLPPRQQPPAQEKPADAAAKDERTSLLDAMIKEPKLETLQKLLTFAEVKQPPPMELLDDSRRHSGKEKKGGEVRVIGNGSERLAIVSAKVIPIIEPSDVAIRVDPERRAECAFVFDMQGRLIDTIGGKLSGGQSLGGDDIHIVNLGPEEDWFVRVMNFEKRGELTHRSDYYRIANPIVKSFRFFNLPNACSWSNGPEKIPRQGRLHPAHPQAQRPSYAGVPNAIPVTTAAGVPTVSAIVWDGDRNRFVAAPSAFVKGLPLYEVDTTWSREFEPLEPQPGQLTVEGGIREYDHWYAWETAVPDRGNATAVLTLPQRDGPAKVIEKKLAPGRHTLQLQAKPKDNGPGVQLKLWIDEGQKFDFDLPFAFGEVFANHPRIVNVLSLSHKTPELRFQADANSIWLVHRLLKDTTAALLFEIKLQAAPQPADSEDIRISTTIEGTASEPETIKPDASLDELVDTALKVYGKRLLGRLNAPWQIMHSLRAIGPTAMLRTSETNPRTILALDWLSNGAKWKDEPVWRVTEFGAEGHSFTKPYEFEGHPGQFLAALADANVPVNRHFVAFDNRGQEKVISVRDLVQDAKQKVNEREVMSWLLRGLSHYEPPTTEWKLASGEVWSIERLVKQELNQRTAGLPDLGTWNLSSLAHARHRYLATRSDQGAPLPQLWNDVQDKLTREITIAKSLQNPDGSFSSHGNEGRGVARDFNELIRTTGLTLTWMVVTMSPAELREPPITRAIEKLSRGLIEHAREATNVSEWGYAVYALRLYREKTQAQAVNGLNGTRPENRARGVLKGRFIYDGEAPKPRDLRADLSKLNKDSEVPRDSEGRPIGMAMWYMDYLKAGIRPKTEDASLLVDKDGGVANVIVWVTTKDIPWAPKDYFQTPEKIFVKDGHFTPRVRSVTAGQPLVVENTDPVPFTFATMFSRNSDVNALLSPAANKKPFRIDKLESEQRPAPFKSNVATWANGFVFVRDNNYVAISQPDGTFTMPDLPPGEWEFRAWHERRGYLEHWPKGTFQQKIQPGDNEFGTIKLKPELFELASPN